MRLAVNMLIALINNQYWIGRGCEVSVWMIFNKRTPRNDCPQILEVFLVFLLQNLIAIDDVDLLDSAPQTEY